MAGIALEPYSGFLSCEDPERLKRVCARLGPHEIDRIVRKWLHHLPGPLQRTAGPAIATTSRSSGPNSL